MSDIIKKLDSHEPLLVGEGKERDLVEIPLDDFTMLIQLAHAFIHSDAPGVPDLQDLVDKELGETEIVGKTYKGEDSTETMYDIGMVDGDAPDQLRGQALHYAVQVDIARTQAAHGLEALSDPVGLAESMLTFLKGGL